MSGTVVGTIAKWNDDRGFGFIAPSGGGDDVFVHVSAFEAGGRRPIVGDAVRFSQDRDGRGRLQARGVVFISGAGSGRGGKRQGIDLRLLLVVGFFLALGLIWLAGGFPAMVVLFYAVMSTVAYGMYALDKQAARDKRWRVAESSLHLVALAGGWPGALLAQKRLRHKTRKRIFQLVFRSTVLLNCVALGWLAASPESDQLLAELVGMIQ